MENQTAKKTILFDFDGTIADSMPLFINAYRAIAKSNGLPQLTNEEILPLRHMTANLILKKFGISIIKTPYYLWQGRKYVKAHSDELHIFEGIAAVIQSLSKSYRLGILTSNDTTIVKSFLKKYDLECFEFVQSEFNIFGKDRALRSVIQSYGIDKKHVIYVGDEVRDIEACKKVGIPICSVTWGLNDEGILRASTPDFLISEPQQLLSVISE